MKCRRWFVLVLLTAGAGCCLLTPAPPMPPAVREYRAREFQWNAVGRVLVLPLANETKFHHAAEEVRTALVAELQALGRFEVVPAPCDGPVGILVSQVRVAGRFNETALIELARMFRADVILMGTMTQYSPYPPPRLGLAIQAVSPFDALVVASVDGLWDTASKPTADLARAFYRMAHAPRQPATASALVFDSPRLFQRFVAAQAARALTGFDGQNLGSPPHKPGFWEKLGWFSEILVPPE